MPRSPRSKSPQPKRQKSQLPHLGSNVLKLIMNRRNLNKELAAKTLQSKYRGNKSRMAEAKRITAMHNKNLLSKGVKVRGIRRHLQNHPQRLENARKKAGLNIRPRNWYPSYKAMPPSFWTSGKVPKYYLRGWEENQVKRYKPTPHTRRHIPSW